MDLTHLFTFFRGLGGVQSVLRRHFEHDERLGIGSRFVLFFEGNGLPSPRVKGLALNSRSTISLLRRRFQQAVGEARTTVALYHNLWGLPLCSDLDQAQRRIGVLHSHWPGMEWQLPLQRGLLDGVLCVTAPLQAVAARSFPELDRNRIGGLPYPVGIPDRVLRNPRSPAGNHPIVLGYCGRLARDQKRVDRLPKLIHELEASGLDYRFEFLGDGPQRSFLEARLVSNPRIRFHGSLTGEEYWNILRQWEFIVFTSDYEGLPISMLEAMALGVLPLYPEIASGGESYARDVFAGLVYRTEDYAQIVNQLRWWASLEEFRKEEFRNRSRSVVKGHLGENYDESFSGQVREIAALPRISRITFRPRAFHLTDHCPFAVLQRVWSRGFFRTSAP